MRDYILNFIKNIISNFTKLSPEKIQLNIAFEKYGISSIVQLNLIREFEKIIGEELPKTLLFEYSNTQELVDYFLNNYPDKLLQSIPLERDTFPTSELYNNKNHQNIIVSNSLRKSRFKKMQRNISEEQGVNDIAIIGISGRYPLSNTLEELWTHLELGHNCITEAPHNRWFSSLNSNFTSKINEEQQNLQEIYGGFLKDINYFDHYLFEIPEADVWQLSPETRLFMEIVWELFEDAGYTKIDINDLQTSYRAGVWSILGTMYNQYPWYIPSAKLAKLSSNDTEWNISNRASHFFNLTGPSISINSACSSSLTAVHLACESLKQNSCSMAVAGGVNLTLDLSLNMKHYKIHSFWEAEIKVKVWGR